MKSSKSPLLQCFGRTQGKKKNIYFFFITCYCKISWHDESFWDEFLVVCWNKRSCSSTIGPYLPYWKSWPCWWEFDGWTHLGWRWMGWQISCRFDLIPTSSSAEVEITYLWRKDVIPVVVDILTNISCEVSWWVWIHAKTCQGKTFKQWANMCQTWPSSIPIRCAMGLWKRSF